MGRLVLRSGVCQTHVKKQANSRKPYFTLQMAHMLRFAIDYFAFGNARWLQYAKFRPITALKGRFSAGTPLALMHQYLVPKRAIAVKGLIFVELMNFMEEQFGEQLTDEVVDASAVPHDAAFTTIGRYPSEYATQLIGAAADRTNASAAELCRAFGRYLFCRFEERFPHMIQCYPSARELLHHVEAHIHEEVRSIYPDATPPSVTATEQDGALHVVYQSHRPFAQIAFGLVDQCIVSYGEQSTIEWCEDSSDSHARFIIRSLQRTAA